jgi:hypothetical protein
MKKLLFAFFATAVLISGCNKTETGTTGSNSGPGKLSVKITDDPFNISFVESATVTISKIELRKAGNNDENHFIVISENPVTVDLVDLRNGITTELANLEIPQGSYDLVRLYVDEASLKIKDITDAFRLKVPSGKQTGIKVFIAPAIIVQGGLTSELLLDFDLSRSFVMRGNMAHSAGVNGFIFKPCIRATNNTTAGRIEGFVKDQNSVPLHDAKVWVQKDTVFATTFADAAGYYALIGIPAGIWSVFATQTGYDTVSVASIEIFPGNKTTQDFILTNPLYFISAVIENAAPDKLEMIYSLTLADSVPSSSAFNVTVNSVVRSVTTVAIDNAKVILTLASPVVKGDLITIEYVKPSVNQLQTAEGSKADSITPESVTNNVAQ